ncbi:MAG TPA: paraquat-inducible protein A [Rhodothermales bacterium]
MYTEQLSRSPPGTIIYDVQLLRHRGSYPVVSAIFIASVVMPLAKILVLHWLCWTVMTRRAANAHVTQGVSAGIGSEFTTYQITYTFTYF